MPSFCDRHRPQVLRRVPLNDICGEHENCKMGGRLGRCTRFIFVHGKLRS